MATTITANGINFPDGSASAPSIGGTDTNTGLFTGSDIVGFATGGVERIRINANGKVCINNDTALSDLHICTAGSSEEDGTLRIGGSVISLGLTLDYDQSGATVSRITANPTYTNDDSLLKICVDGDANPNQLVLRGDGNIGIGINDTSANLQIVGSNSAGLLRVGGNQTQAVGLNISYDNSSATTTTFKQNYRASNAGALIKFDSGYFTFHAGTAGGEKLRIDSSGNVIIGQTTAGFQSKLTTGAGSSDEAITILSGTSSGGSLYFADGTAANDTRYRGWVQYIHTSDYLTIGTAGGERLRIASDGRLLLGTQKTFSGQGYYDDITINNSNTASGSAGGTGISLISGNNTWGAILFGDSDDHDVGYIKYSHVGDYMRFATGGSIRARLDSDGLKFHGDTATANGLNDYESGSWTATVMDSGGGTNISINNVAAKYTKIGNQVTCWFRITRNETGSRSGSIRWNHSLPFTTANDINVMATGTWWLDEAGPSSGDSVGGAIYLAPNSNTGYFVHPTSPAQNATNRYLQYSEWSQHRHIYGSFTYYIP